MVACSLANFQYFVFFSFCFIIVNGNILKRGMGAACSSLYQNSFYYQKKKKYCSLTKSCYSNECCKEKKKVIRAIQCCHILQNGYIHAQSTGALHDCNCNGSFFFFFLEKPTCPVSIDSGFFFYVFH